MRVDAQLLRQQSQELATKMAATEQAAYAAAGGPFNLGSPKQLQEVLYERLQLPVLGKTPTGQPSTAEDVLEQLAESYDLPRLVLEYRGLSKLKSTYTDKLPGEIDPRTGRIHTSYHQAVAATGRLSSSDPNLQNIPIRTPEGRRIRQAFVAPPGCKLLAADYSQIELRIMAHLSGDEGLLAAFAAEQDIHRATAAEVFGIAARRRDGRSASLGEGHQLRPDLRHVGLRARKAARHRARRSADLRGRLLRALPRREALHGGDARGRASRGFRQHRIRAAVVSAGDQRQAIRSAASTRSAARSTRRCRALPPTSSSAR